MKALILNSGLGHRMGVLTSEHPKCMTEVSPTDTILSRQLRLLAESGVGEVVMTTGYFDSILVNYCHSLHLPLKYTFVNNPLYRETNYIYSIYCAREALRDDDILAACLAHDMVEDSKGKVTLENLPVNETVREAVRLVTKPAEEEKQKDKDWEKEYYANIRKNPLACLVKCLDRVNNIAGMADIFSREKMIRYARETDKYYPALLEVLKKIPEWNDAWWLLRYQLITTLEAFKRLL